MHYFVQYGTRDLPDFSREITTWAQCRSILTKELGLSEEKSKELTETMSNNVVYSSGEETWEIPVYDFTDKTDYVRLAKREHSLTFGILENCYNTLLP